VVAHPDTRESDAPGIAVGALEAAESIFSARPDVGLEQLYTADQRLVLDEAKALLLASRRALREGRLILSVPASLAGGRLHWTGRAGDVREVLTQRLSGLTRDGLVTREQAALIVARYGLDGFPGGASVARQQLGRGRQATTNALNAALRVMAADIAAQPLLPISAPQIDKARREEIVGSVLSTMSGPPEAHPLRRYVHARVRQDLLNDPVETVPLSGSTERQRAHRAVQEWIAIASDHLDRQRLPWARYPAVEPDGERELRDWLSAPDVARSSSALSVEGVRALARPGLSELWANETDDRDQILGMLTDGYRPLIELTAIAAWASQPGPGTDKAHPPPIARATILLNLASLVALRGFHHLAITYVGRSNSIIDSHTIDPARRRAYRFRQGLALEAISFLRGPDQLSETRKWQARLAVDLADLPSTRGEAQTLAQAIIRTEDCAVQVGQGVASSVAELLRPIQPVLNREFAEAPAENVARLAIVTQHLARRIGDSAALSHLAAPSVAVVSRARSAPSTRYDEWYCAWPAAMARWQLSNPALVDPQGQWRR
jgi:hypothetical protein